MANNIFVTEITFTVTDDFLNSDNKNMISTKTIKMMKKGNAKTKKIQKNIRIKIQIKINYVKNQRQ